MARAHDDTSAALMAAAHRLLASEGPDALTVRRIAAEADMSTMNVYSRFGGKDGVIDELYHDGFERLSGAVERVSDSDGAIDHLVSIAAAYRDFAIANPRYYEIMFGSLATSTSTAAGMPTGLERCLRRIEHALGSIELRDGLDPGSAAIWMWAACHGVISLELNGLGDGSLDWPQIYGAGVHAAIDGLGARAAVATPGS